MFLLLMLACARDPEPPQGPGVRLSLDVPAEAELPADPLFTVRDDDYATITADLRPGDTA